MNIHEYQAKALLRQYGAPVSDGRVVMKADEAKAAAGELDGPLWVVKAQIHAGGRGKGHFKEAAAGEKGGVRLAQSVSEAEELTRQMLGRTLVTHQTGETGKQVNRIYIEDGSDIARELYLALLVDRQTSRISFVCSTEGGMDIEEVAAATPEKILSFSVDPASGLSDFHGRRLAYNAGPGRPRNWRNGPVLEGAIWAENVPFGETRDYVKKVLANTTDYAAILSGQPQSLKARLGQVGPAPADEPPLVRDLP